MKLAVSTLLFIIVCTSAQGQITWSAPVTVTTGNGSNLHPRVALNRSGNPYVLWGQTDTKAYVSKLSGSTFTTPIAVNGMLTIFAQSWAGPDLAGFGDTVYVSMKVTPETSSSNHAYLAHSYDGGSTFSMPARIDNIDTSTSRFPIVTTTSNGNPLVAFMKFNATLGNAHYVVCRSTDFGNTFSADVLASGTAGMVCDCCPATVLSSGSKAVMLFRNNLSNIRDTWAGISSDGGATFTTNLLVDNNNWSIASCPASGPDGFINGDTLYAVFRSSASGTARTYLSRSSISGLTSSTAPLTGAVTGLLGQDYPRIANAGNAAAVVWQQNATSGKSIVYSFTKNITTTALSTFSVVATGSGMMNADVAMSPGTVHIVWEDDNAHTVMYMKGTYTVPVVPTGLAETSKELIDIYPNPASRNFTVSLKRDFVISSSYLTDMTGKIINLLPKINGSVATFSVEDIARGNYYFVLNDENGKRCYSKLVVE